MPEIRLRAVCHPTEDLEKVVGAIHSVFPEATVEGDRELVAVSSSLEVFRELIKRQRIRDAARSVLMHGIEGETTSFRLSKQVAAVGKVSFATESHPLGDIEVTIASENVRDLIESLTSHEGGDGS